MKQMRALGVLFFLSVQSGCVGANVTPLDALTPSSALSETKAGVLMLAGFDKTSPRGAHCQLQVTDAAAKKFVFNVTRESNYQLLEIAPGKYQVSRLDCTADSSIEISNISFEVVPKKVTIGPFISMNLKNQTLHYTYGAPQGDAFLQAMREIGENTYAFHMSADSVNNITHSVQQVIPPSAVNFRYHQVKGEELDFKTIPDIAPCDVWYFLNRPTKAQPMTFVATYKDGVFSGIKDYKPQANDTPELTRKECIKTALQNWKPAKAIFEIHSR